ncbi:MAG TPA: LuxR C-terminal-related transcriptional regulator [Ktedonobacteraceae bacterium]|nr:LuxR C-terminal-related transcriptional regulator [Ktedonobacteraceae bacterium]
MPKSSQYMLAWLEKHEIYELREQHHATVHVMQNETTWWFSWLASHSSFSFQGKDGHLTLLKEPRVRGTDYWYAYRSLNGRTLKKYAGRTADLTVARLEEIARTLQPFPPTAFQRSPIDLLPLLESKLHLPHLPASLVARERLLERLDGGLAHRLTLLSAPAGFGKTTLVSQWVASRRTRGQLSSVSWLSLDSSDNDPVRFWRYIITACQSFQANLGHTSLAQLSMLPVFERPELETVLTYFLNDLAHSACSGLLVLEDYHLITETRIHATMAFWLEHLPATLHLLLLTRGEPPLPLVRWRARGDLYEIHSSDLRFSSEETATFLQQSLPISLTEDEQRQLDTHLEGWAAGLRLLSLALQGHTTSQGSKHIITSFVGNQTPHRTLQEYLVTEVLNAQPQELQNFLLQTSVLSHLTGSLCDAITASHNSERLLELLERSNLFLGRLDGPDQGEQWYRYHALFAEAMQQEARRRLGIDTLHTLSLQASRRYEEHGQLTEAVEAAFQAQDIQRAAELIEHLIGTQPLQEVQECHTLRRWLEQMPEALLQQHPSLCLSYAAALLFVYILDSLSPPAKVMQQLEKHLQMAEQGFRALDYKPGLGIVFAFRAMIARPQSKYREATACARQALGWLPAKETMWRSISLNAIGEGELREGWPDKAHKTILEARALSEASARPSFTRANTVHLSRVYFEQGKLQQAANLYRNVLAEAREQEDRDDIADAQLGLSQLSYEWNGLQTAEQQAQEALDLAEQIGDEELQVRATLVLARIEHAHKQTILAQQRLTMLLARMPAVTMPPSRLRYRLLREIHATLARLQLAGGDLDAARYWLSSSAAWQRYFFAHSDNEATYRQPDEELPHTQHEQEAILVARYLLLQERAEEAQEMLKNLLESAQEAGRIHSMMEIQVLMALVCSSHPRKQMQEARQLLQMVLSRTYPEGYQRLFLDEGEVMVTLLQTVLPTIHGEALTSYTRNLLLAFAQERENKGNEPAPLSSALVEPLSAQEQRVLRLLAAGRSNPEIARELVVSINTVKAHVQSIYRKLNVNNRVAASEIARQLKLL